MITIYLLKIFGEHFTSRSPEEETPAEIIQKQLEKQGILRIKKFTTLTSCADSISKLSKIKGSFLLGEMKGNATGTLFSNLSLDQFQGLQ